MRNCASEVDPSFSASEAASITAAQTSQWNTAYSWGDHATQGYSTSDTLASLNCVSGQIPLWSGTAWGCGDDQDSDTQLTEGQVDVMVENNGFLAPDPAGNVGIGTANPTAKLTVDGTIESISGGVKFPDGTTQTTAATGVQVPTMMSGQSPTWQNFGAGTRYCRDLTEGGFTDWRLPTREEVISVVQNSVVPNAFGTTEFCTTEITSSRVGKRQSVKPPSVRSRQ